VAVLEALAGTLREWKVRANPEDNILNAPGAGTRSSTRWRACASGIPRPTAGGVNVILARFLELGDPSVPRGDGWEQLLEAFFGQNPPCSARPPYAPCPDAGGPVGEIAHGRIERCRPGVMRTACTVAGESKNQIFAEPLGTSYGRSARVGRARSQPGADQTGAHWVATEAWIERLGDEKLHGEGLRFLAEKLEHPESTGPRA